MAFGYRLKAEDALRRTNRLVRANGGQMILLGQRRFVTVVDTPHGPVGWSFELLVMITDRMGEPVLFGVLPRPWDGSFTRMWEKTRSWYAEENYPERPMGIAQWLTPSWPPTTVGEQVQAGLAYIRERYGVPSGTSWEVRTDALRRYVDAHGPVHIPRPDDI